MVPTEVLIEGPRPLSLPLTAAHVWLGAYHRLVGVLLSSWGTAMSAYGAFQY